MPTPEAFRTGDIDVFELTPEQEKSLQVQVLYATNRLPASNVHQRGYGRKFDNQLRLGEAFIQIGDDDAVSWEQLYAVSTIEERGSDILLKLKRVQEFIAIDKDVDTRSPPSEMLRLLGELDMALEQSRDKDLLIFVHGAKNDFYRSVGQAAQYRHFTGRHSVVLAFVWPSQENILQYGTDVRNAVSSAPLLATLVELLAIHTQARNINILGYSLGAIVVSNSLYQLHERYQDEDSDTLRQRLRIGEVYFAAADLALDEFTDHLRHYHDMVGRVSMTLNPDDSALEFASMVHRKSRAGRPDPGELSDEDSRWLQQLSRTERLDLIEVQSAISPYAALKAHDYWYANPRVSMDILIQMLSHATPDKRGLEEQLGSRGFRYWSFPENYQERAIQAVKALLAESEATGRPQDM
jgi:esterase/lipase superfamily enzyme